MKPKIPYTKPSITDLEINYATDAATNGWGERCYEYIYRFEELFKQHLNVSYAIATSSCTGALHMGLHALGIGPDDEVVMADTNWIATAAPICHLGAKPIFVDIRPDTWCIDYELVEKAITPRTKAIMAVHLYGNLCNMDKLLAIGAKYGIPVIEDAAEAIGSVWHGHRAGSMGAFGAFSFHGTKTLTTGEGGMFVTNDPNLYERVLTLSNHGRARGQSKQFWPEMLGFKYKMSNIQAAIGYAQMERIEKLIGRKREIFHYYKQGLKSIPGLKLNPEPSGTQNGFWMPNIEFGDSKLITKLSLQQNFEKNNIDARVFFWPLSSLPMFTAKQENEHAYRTAEYALNLPTFHDMTTEDQDRVIEVIGKVAGELN